MSFLLILNQNTWVPFLFFSTFRSFVAEINPFYHISVSAQLGLSLFFWIVSKQWLNRLDGSSLGASPTRRWSHATGTKYVTLDSWLWMLANNKRNRNHWTRLKRAILPPLVNRESARIMANIIRSRIMRTIQSQPTGSTTALPKLEDSTGALVATGTKLLRRIITLATVMILLGSLWPRISTRITQL